MGGKAGFTAGLKATLVPSTEKGKKVFNFLENSVYLYVLKILIDLLILLTDVVCISSPQTTICSNSVFLCGDN